MNHYNENDANMLFKDHIMITKALFSKSEETTFEDFHEEIKNYLKKDNSYHEILQHILGIFSIARPSEKDILLKIEQSFSLSHFSKERDFESDYPRQLPRITNLCSPNSEIITLIKSDDFQTLYDKFLCKENFDYSQTFDTDSFEDNKINLLDISAYSGSVKCFKHFLLNNVPFTEYVCPFSVAGGNLEIIRILEGNNASNTFSDSRCFDMSILYHRYAISDWLILNYNHTFTSKEFQLSALSFNFIAFSYAADKLNSEMPPHFLHQACQYGNLPIVQYLCQVHKANTEEKDVIGATPLHSACLKGYLPIVKYLCEVHQVDTEPKDMYGQTALHYACLNGCLPIIQYLCEVKKINAEIRDRKGWTALYNACAKGYLPAVQYLCEVQKVNTEVTDKINRTPLHVSCNLDNLPIIKYLCEVQKVNTELKDKKGKTASQIASSNGQTKIAEYLSEYTKASTEAKEAN